METSSHNQSQLADQQSLDRLRMRALQKGKGTVTLPYAVKQDDQIFDWQFYIHYYEDLVNIATYEEAYEHWIVFGQIEGRFPNDTALKEHLSFKALDLPEDFNPEHYLQLNPDIKQRFLKHQYRDIKAIEHYLEHGRHENRPYQSAFDWQFYIQYYDDLKDAKTFEAAYEHWLAFGQQEGRYCSEAKLKDALNKYRLELPESFNYQVYLQLNPDLEARFSTSPYQEAQATEHFLRYGASEGRAYSIDAIAREQLALTVSQIRKKLEIKPPYKISIKICAPNLREGCQWGDFHYAHSLKRAFDQQGHHCRIDCQDTWNTPVALEDDIVIALRGRHRYITKEHQVNFLWLISHPDRVADEELNEYDHVFVASYEYTQKLSKRLTTQVSCMYQCTDATLFNPIETPEVPASEILFVGSSRNVYRPIVRDAINLGINLSIYGPLWEKFVPSSLIKGDYISNDQLCHYYSNCTILLNDHWDTMRQEGFLSNRLFDASGCGTFVITDAVLGLERIFSNCIETYSNPQELKEKILFYSQNKTVRSQKAAEARQIVLTHHTFDHRVKQFLAAFDQLRSLHEIRYQKLNRLLWQDANGVYLQNSIPEKLSIEVVREEAKILQLRFFHANVSSLEHGICNYGFHEAPIFYEWIWRISRKNHKYADFVAKFVASELKLLDSLSASIPGTCGKELPLVSIIMPTFNRAYVIADSIQSVLEQTHKNWKLFICDDGSTDNTKAVVEQFQDERIHYFQLPKANGSSARNFGLKYSSGEYIAYLDSDNIWHPQHLSICIQSLEAKPHAMSCYTGYVDTETIRNKVELKELTCYTFDYYKLLNRNFIDLNSFVHRRCLFDWLSGFDEELPRLQDWDLVLRYTYLFDPVVIETYTVFYRRNVAWNQVTKLFANVDVRSIVQDKIFDFIDRPSSVLQLKQPGNSKVSLLCSTQDQKDWLKVLAIADSLVKVLDVQVVAVSSLDFQRKMQTYSNVKIHWIHGLSSDELSPVQIIREKQCQRQLNQILSAISNTVTLLFTDNSLCLIAAGLAYSFHHQPISILHQHYQKFLRELEDLSNLNYDLSYDRAFFQSLSINNFFNFQSILNQIRTLPLSHFMEIASEKETFDSVAIGSTITDSLSQIIDSKQTDFRVSLGFSTKDYVIAFWEESTNYTADELQNFKAKLNSKQCQVVVLRRLEFGISDQSPGWEIDDIDGLKIVLVKSEQQAIKALMEIDLCVLWGGMDDKSRFQLPLEFIYSLACSCIPIVNTAPTYRELDLLNYCKAIPYKNWSKLIECCRLLLNDPHKLDKLKRNAQRLYSLKFSQKVVREKIKYLIFDSCRRMFQSPLKLQSSAEAALNDGGRTPLFNQINSLT
ncbi:MAG: glycosyltransferase [Elainella sp. Prado103]|jgi:glycosyltransferase involved in cell wall biosynthesis|nr:glycosyltransferase [Elainella sp. Prado103]